jgi:imidazolonepropionase-like amidohydrolase
MRLILRRANVLDGVNPGRPGMTVVVSGNRIENVTSQDVPALDGDRVVDLAGQTVMPGLWGCHFHAEYDPQFGSQMETLYLGSERPNTIAFLLASKHAGIALQSGITGVIGAGCSQNNDSELKMAIDEGICPGPRVIPSGQHLNPVYTEWPGGKYWFEMGNTGTEAFANGVEGFRALVRKQARHGTKVLKIFPSGGHGVHTARGMRTLSTDEIRSIVDTAHDRGIKVRAHCTYKPLIMECIELGVDIIDHGDELDNEVLDAMVQSGTFYVPSLMYSKTMSQIAIDMEDDYLLDHHQSGLKNVTEWLAEANDRGVRIVTGDDYGIAPMPHSLGIYAKEYSIYADECGVKKLDVLTWATRNGAEMAGMGGETGAVEVGKLADLLVMDGDPSEDLHLLEDPARNLKAVIKDGQFYKDELA